MLMLSLRMSSRTMTDSSSNLATLVLAAIAIIGITDGFTLRQQLIFPSLMQHGHPPSSLFAIPPTQDYLNALSSREENDDDEDASSKNFWGSPRNEREIIDFISEAVFNEVSHHEAASSALNDNVAPTIDQHLRRIEVISEEPPLVIVHGFLTSAYCDDIMRAVVAPDETSSMKCKNIKNQLRRSTMGVARNESEERTSSTAWLHHEHCPKPLEAFSGRVSALSGIPTGNFENLQVVRYQPGQEFQVHTDHLDVFNEMACGGRLATCLLYLNDSEDTLSEVSNNGKTDEAFTGGETFFHQFNKAVSPRKGSALFWWNTKERPGSSNYDKNMFLNVDLKLRHAGLPVLTGEKWICNKWLHPLPFPNGV